MASARLVALAAFLHLLLTLGPGREARAADDGEVRALLALGAALDPTGRLLPSWAPGRDPCAPPPSSGGGFEGVACDARGAVANVSLQGKGLAGTLTPAVAGLRSLTGLYLHYNALRGGIPRELAALDALTDLYLDVNNFSGPIPPEIGAMVSLQGTPTPTAIHLCICRLSSRFLGTFIATHARSLTRIGMHVAAPWTLPALQLLLGSMIGSLCSLPVFFLIRFRSTCLAFLHSKSIKSSKTKMRLYLTTRTMYPLNFWKMSCCRPKSQPSRKQLLLLRLQHFLAHCQHFLSDLFPFSLPL